MDTPAPLTNPTTHRRTKPLLVGWVLAQVTLALWLCGAVAVAEEDPAPAAVDPPTFESKLSELRGKYDAAIARLDAEALTKYQALKARYGESGNLDGLVWVANQIAALKGEPQIPGGNPDAFPKSNPIDAERQAGADRFGSIFVAEAQKLYSAEISRLDEETKRLTIAGDLEAAQRSAYQLRRLRSRFPKTPPPAPRKSSRVPAEIAEQVFTFGGRSYYLFPEPMNHAEAVEACRAIGGYLLSIGSEGEYDHFHAYSVEKEKPLWIDLNDEDQDLDWRHGAGRKARFVRWQSGEPNGGDSQKHVMIGYRGSWDMRDVNADDRFYVICEW